MDQKDIDSLTGKLKSSVPQKAPIKGVDTVHSDYVHVIRYLEEEKRKNKVRNTVTFILSILTFLCSALGAADLIVRFFSTHG